MDVPFAWYGTYDVRLEKDGYEPLWTTGEADAPWWEYPGPDLVAEAIPGGAVERILGVRPGAVDAGGRGGRGGIERAGEGAAPGDAGV